jgi:hypothetical protein
MRQARHKNLSIWVFFFSLLAIAATHVHTFVLTTPVKDRVLQNDTTPTMELPRKDR